MPSDPDMGAISGHKIYGPKGVGALWLRKGLELPLPIYGGGQEQGMRSGTLSPALCVGRGVAAKLMRDRVGSDAGQEMGRAQVRTPATHAHPACSHLVETKNRTQENNKHKE